MYFLIWVKLTKLRLPVVIKLLLGENHGPALTKLTRGAIVYRVTLTPVVIVACSSGPKNPLC